MTWIIVIIIVAVLFLAVWRLAVWSRDVDEDIKFMNEGRGPGHGIFGIFRRD